MRFAGLGLQRVGEQLHGFRKILSCHFLGEYGLSKGFQQDKADVPAAELLVGRGELQRSLRLYLRGKDERQVEGCKSIQYLPLGSC